MSKSLFFVGVILAAGGFISPPIALLGGLVYGLTLAHPFQAESKKLSKFLLQASVVALRLRHEPARSAARGKVRVFCTRR